MAKIIRLNQHELENLVKESVRRVLKEKDEEMYEQEYQFPQTLYILISRVYPDNFEFDTSIQKGDILEATFREEADPRDYEGEEYGLYDVKEIDGYPLLVSWDIIDTNEEFQTHHSFAYYVYSSKVAAISNKMTKNLSERRNRNSRRLVEE